MRRFDRAKEHEVHEKWKVRNVQNGEMAQIARAHEADDDKRKEGDDAIFRRINRIQLGIPAEWRRLQIQLVDWPSAPRAKDTNKERKTQHPQKCASGTRREPDSFKTRAYFAEVHLERVRVVNAIVRVVHQCDDHGEDDKGVSSEDNVVNVIQPILLDPHADGRHYKRGQEQRQVNDDNAIEAGIVVAIGRDRSKENGE